MFIVCARDVRVTETHGALRKIFLFLFFFFFLEKFQEDTEAHRISQLYSKYLI